MKRLGVFTSGGDSPGMNAAIRAVVRAGCYYDIEVVGIERGFAGLISDDIRVLGARDVSGILGHGGTILRSARCDEFLKPEGRERAAANVRKRGIEGLVAIGGDGTYKGVVELEEEHGVRCVGMPGTIDNDIGGTDTTIGYNTALNTALDAIDRLRDTAHSHDRIFFVEVMGRHSGYLAMMSGIAGGAEQILVPETPTDLNALVEALRDAKRRGKTSSVVVVAEGDDAGNALEIAKKVADISEFKDTRATVIGHLQRGGAPTAYDRILASRLGVLAVETLRSGQSSVMTAAVGNEVLVRPIADAWNLRTTFDPSYLRLAEILAT